MIVAVVMYAVFAGFTAGILAAQRVPPRPIVVLALSVVWPAAWVVALTTRRKPSV